MKNKIFCSSKMDEIVEEVIEDALKKDSWLKRLCRRFSFRSKCCCGSECQLSEEEKRGLKGDAPLPEDSS